MSRGGAKCFSLARLTDRLAERPWVLGLAGFAVTAGLMLRVGAVVIF